MEHIVTYSLFMLLAGILLIPATLAWNLRDLKHHRYGLDLGHRRQHDEYKDRLWKKTNGGWSNDRDTPVEIFNFTQKLDHFNAADDREWQQVAYINKQYYKPGGPIFLLLGGEGPSTSRMLLNSSMANIYAPKLNAMMLQIEHRFYGRSWPTPDMSIGNMRFLSSQQALADAANFIVQMTEKLQLDSNTRWVTFGGSYSGALSAWMRLKYPHLVYASIASSAPVEAVLDFSGYLEVVVDTLNSNDDEKQQQHICVETLKQATASVVELMGSAEGRAKLHKIFNLCSPLTNIDVNEKDIWSFYSTLIDGFEGVVQYNHDFPLDVADVCEHYLDNITRGAPIERMRDFLLDFSGTSDCVDFAYKDAIVEAKNTSWFYWMIPGGRQWLWQTCTEFGYFQTTATEKTIFETELPLDFYLDICADVFGVEDESGNYSLPVMQRRIDWTNSVYGGNSSRSEWSRVFFVNGGADPWHVLSVLAANKSHTKDAMQVFVVPGQSHCADMYAPTPTDTTEMRQARHFILKALELWL